LLTKSTATLRFHASLRPGPPFRGRSFGRLDEISDLVEKASALSRAAACILSVRVLYDADRLQTAARTRPAKRQQSGKLEGRV
jgi:hypothetical protein